MPSWAPQLPCPRDLRVHACGTSRNQAIVAGFFPEVGSGSASDVRQMLPRVPRRVDSWLGLRPVPPISELAALNGRAPLAAGDFRIAHVRDPGSAPGLDVQLLDVAELDHRSPARLTLALRTGKRLRSSREASLASATSSSAEPVMRS